MPNAAPIAFNDFYTVHQGQALNVAAVSGVLANDTDADNDNLTATIVSYTSHGYGMVSSDGSFFYSSNAGFVGTDSFTYKANDGTADSNTATVTINVTNTAPVVHDHGPYEVYAGGSLSVSAATGPLSDATDADGDALTASVVTYPSHGYLMVSSDGSFFYNPDYGYSGADSFTLTANDGAADSNTATVSLTVNPAYVVVIQGDRYDVAGETVSVDLYSNHVDGHSVTFSATGLPSGLSINSSTGVISGTITNGADSETPYAVTVTGTDSAGGASDTASFSWTVSAPVVTILSVGDLEDIVGASIEVPAAAVDSNGAELTYSATGLPTGLTIDSDTGVISGTIASSADTNSPYSVVITATDPDTSVYSSESFAWTISHLVLRNPGYQMSLVSGTVSLTVGVAYADIGTLAFSATGLPSGLSINSATGEISGTIASNADTNSPYTVTVTVTDGTLSANQTFKWATRKLYLQNPGGKFSFDGDTVSEAITSSAPAGYTIAFSAAGLPSGLTISASTGTISGTVANDADAGGPYSVTITATDSTASVSVSKTFTWIVDIQNAPPLSDPVPYQLPARGTDTPVEYLFRARDDARAAYHQASRLVDFLTDILPTLDQRVRDIRAAHPNTFRTRADYIAAVEQYSIAATQLEITHHRLGTVYRILGALDLAMSLLNIREA